MKKFIFYSFLLCFIAAFSQNTDNNRETEWFDELAQSYYDGDYMTAYLGFGKFVEHYPKSDLVPRAVFNQACLLRELGKDNEAKAIFKKIMNSNFDEREAYGGIMEQYALYKNRSSKHLAEIYLSEKDFKNAAWYIHLFDKVYPYQHFCGNELSANAIYTDTMYAKLYYGKGKIEKAIKILLPHMFFNGLAGNQEALDLLGKYLPKLYSKEELQVLFKTSVANFKPTDANFGKLKLLNVHIPVYEYQLYTENQDFDWEDESLGTKERFLHPFKAHPVLSPYLNE